ncbi:MAG TPA: VOC family protein [Acetobacteraceae bacterium]|nr:VOC family protein [Acetobacteraceae bacterium]
MAATPARFCWYELLTPDPKASETFYRSVAGWGTQPSPVPGMPYTLLTVGDVPVGGMMELNEQMRASGASTGWIGYVAVDDVDAASAKAARLGAMVHVPPTDIPTIGRFSVITDPQGAAITLFTPSRAEPEAQVGQDKPGQVGWHELHTADWPKAMDFYAEMFGWEKGEGMDMKEMGIYQIFTIGGQMLGGMFNRSAAEPKPYWLYYVNTGDIDAAVGRVSAGGGKIVNGPMQVPGDAWIVQGIDPQGATFALVGKRG